MAMEEYFDPYGDDEDRQPVNDKVCKFCGEAGLHWEEDNGKWVLVTSKEQIHKCKPKPINLSQLV